MPRAFRVVKRRLALTLPRGDAKLPDSPIQRGIFHMTKLLFTSAATLALSAGIAAADYTLHVIHINDLHSRIEPINRFDSTCNAEDNAAGECFGGYARVATKIAELRAHVAGLLATE